MRKPSLTIALAALCMSTGAQMSEQPHTYSIEELFALADQNNSTIHAHRTATAAAAATMQSAQAARLPSIDAAWQVSYIGNGTMTARNFTNAVTFALPHFGNNFTLQATQVVYAGGAIDGAIHAASLQHEMAALDAERARQQVRFLIAGNYLEVCKLRRGLAVYDSHIVQTERVIAAMQVKAANGTALANDITRYELQLLNLQYAKVQLHNSIALATQQLSVAAGLPVSTAIDVDTTIFHTLRVRVDDLSYSTALPLLMAAKGEELAAAAHTIERAERLPTIAIFAGDYFNSPIMTEVPVLNNNFNFWMLGLQVKYNISSWYKANSRIRAASLAVVKAQDYKRAASEHTMLQMEDARTHYEEAFVLLRTKEKSMELAAQNYDVVAQRYQNDLALITDLLDAAAAKLDAQLQAINARISIAYHYYKLKFVSGTL